MRKLNKMDDMFDDRDAVVQTSINGVTYDCEIGLKGTLFTAFLFCCDHLA